LLQDGQVVCDGDTAQVISRYRAMFGDVHRAQVDLTTWPTRQGRGELARFTSAAICNLDGELGSTIPMGSGIIVNLGITFFQNIHAVDVGLAFINLLGARLSHLVSSWENLNQPVKEGTYSYDITIPHLPFVPGSYSIIIWMKPQNGQTEDRIEDALGVEVTPTPIHNGSIPRFEKYCQPGETFIASEWTVRPH
jgi:hypothetical protein